MSVETDALQYQRIRAPQADRSVYLSPEWNELASTVSRNQQMQRGYEIDFLGKSHAQLAALARKELVSHAQQYTAQYLDLPTELAKLDAVQLNATQPILITGHQAELFHPGVWAKNFCLSDLGKQLSAVRIHLIVDSDTIDSPDLKVPTGTIENPRVERIAFEQRDTSAAILPVEERTVRDPATWKTFGSRVAEKIQPLIPNPIIKQFWSHVQERSEANGQRLGLAFAQARHQLEQRWGQQSLELPLSVSCQFESFHWFTAHLLSNLPCFSEIYNRGIQEFRKLHRIRSKTRPVPELVNDDHWLEAPFWIWSVEKPVRKRLFVKQQKEQLFLSDRENIDVQIPFTEDGDGTKTVAALAQLAAQGIKIRTRALTTTLWSRLLLGDLFIHGIGGAKYDQLTDYLIQEFYGCSAPEFVTLSATLLLPIETSLPNVSEAKNINQQLRETIWNPDRILATTEMGSSAEIQELLLAKQGLINTQRTKANARQRFREFRRINESLQPFVQEQKHSLQQSRACLEQLTRNNQILASREYSFALYPEEYLQKFVTNLFDGHR